MIKGLIFDFDGLILDTETSEYVAWQEIYQKFGLELPVERWAAALGSSLEAFNPLDDLQQRVPDPLDRLELKTAHDQRARELMAGEQIRPGVAELIQAGKNAGLGVGLASSSPAWWVYPHLHRLGLSNSFDCLQTKECVERIKPAPDLYLSALDCLGLVSPEAVAFEDSPNGVAAAKAAGLFCLAVPNPLSARLDLSQADKIVPTLAGLPLEEIIRWAGEHLSDSTMRSFARNQGEHDAG